ncbi:MAG TPA: hypothetical protein VGI39_26365, partial [Polyangiaceae bacterium]
MRRRSLVTLSPLLLLPFAPLACQVTVQNGNPGTSNDAGAPDGSSVVDGSAPGVDAGPPLPFAPGSPWPKFRGDARQDGVGQVHAHTTGGAKWAYQTGKGIFSSPVVAADGTVYI